jgi:hypothetical protein
MSSRNRPASFNTGRALDQDFVSTEQTETVGSIRFTPNSGRESKSRR